MNTLQYVTHNEAELHISGTCLQGETKASYAELVDLFGEPMEGDGYKVDAEWIVRFGDGTLATIYNWKDGPNYCGEDGTPVREIKDWHIGGMTKQALDSVQITLDLHREGAAKGAKRTTLDEMFDARETLLKSLETQHGKGFADAVYFANLCMKQMEIFAFVSRAAIDGTQIPEKAVDAIGNAASSIIAKMLDGYCQAVGVASESSEARAITKWAEKLDDVEQTGMKTFLRETTQKRRAA